MSRAVSIHIGVNVPQGRLSGHPLRESETLAWRMAGLAERAGYDSLRVLRGPAATRRAVHEALTGAAGALGPGDTVFVSFAGHGLQEPDRDGDEGHGWDEGWCLADGVLVDDKLAGYWRLFDAGVRIVVVAESCYSGGSGRDDHLASPGRPILAPTVRVMRDGGTGTRTMRDGGSRTPVMPNGGYVTPAPSSGGFGTPVMAPVAAAHYAASCIAEAPRSTDGIRASLLLLAAAREEQPAQEGLFTKYLLKLWADGAFPGSYCDLHRQIRDCVMSERCTQEPQILMLGASDPSFPLEPAFRVDRGGPSRDRINYR